MYLLSIILLPILKPDPTTSADAGSEVRVDGKHHLYSVLGSNLSHKLHVHAGRPGACGVLWGASCHPARTGMGTGLAEFRGKNPLSSSQGQAPEMHSSREGMGKCLECPRISTAHHRDGQMLICRDQIVQIECKSLMAKLSVSVAPSN